MSEGCTCLGCFLAGKGGEVEAQSQCTGVTAMVSGWHGDVSSRSVLLDRAIHCTWRFSDSPRQRAHLALRSHLLTPFSCSGQGAWDSWAGVRRMQGEPSVPFRQIGKHCLGWTGTCQSFWKSPGVASLLRATSVVTRAHIADHREAGAP